MRRSALRFLATSSLLLAMATAQAAERPRYGGTLRVATHEDWQNSGLRRLLFENLVSMDGNGNPRAQLATTWQAQNEGRRWQFWLRRGVRFHDGAEMNAAAVAAALTSGECETCPWTAVRAVGDSVVFEFGAGRTQFAAEMALPRYAIARAVSGNQVGTGPFRISERSRNGTMVLEAFDDYWGGRPFLDAVEATLQRGMREQAADLEGGRADVAEGPPEQLRRWQQQRGRTQVSQPVELIALMVNPAKPALQDVRLRQALALAIDRGTIVGVVLQKQGEAAGGVLPNWISGYAFLLAQGRDLGKAQQLRAQVGNVPQVSISAEAGDATLQLIAERIALNARDAGIMIVPGASGRSDLIVRRIELKSVNPYVAFATMAELCGGFRGESQPASMAELYQAERDGLAQYWTVPLAWVPRGYAVNERIHDLEITPGGDLRLEQAWVEAQAK